jgi:hypothetical protein
VSPANYELGFYIPEDGNLHGHRRENLTLYREYTCFLLVYCLAWPSFLKTGRICNFETSAIIVTGIITSNTIPMKGLCSYYNAEGISHVQKK